MNHFLHSVSQSSISRRNRSQPTDFSPAANKSIPVSPLQPGLYSKSGCTCGGGCPRCQSEIPLSAVPVGPSSGRHEAEADRIADSIMRKVDQHVTDRRRRDQTPEAAANPSTLLPAAGEALPRSTLHFFRNRLGEDFSHVRIHRDRQAADLARGYRSRAFTLGRDIVFAENQYQPASQQGKRLLAHELVHVMQQSRGRDGGTAQVSSAPQTIQRETESNAAPGTTQTASSACGGWESDRESFTKRVAEHYVADALGTVGHGTSMSCFGAICIWTVQTPNGTISVGVSLAQMPGRVIARQVYVSGVPRCEYDYTCTPNGDLILTRHKCS